MPWCSAPLALAETAAPQSAPDSPYLRHAHPAASLKQVDDCMLTYMVAMFSEVIAHHSGELGTSQLTVCGYAACTRAEGMLTCLRHDMAFTLALLG